MLLRCSHCDLISLDFLWIQWIAYTIGEVNRVLLPKLKQKSKDVLFFGTGKPFLS